MNIIFLSLWKTDNIEEPSPYNDLLRTFRDNGHNITVVSPLERRKNEATHLIKSHEITILKVKTGNIVKANFIEKGVSTLTLAYYYQKAIKQYLSDIKFDLILYTTPPITLLNVVKYLKRRDHAMTYLLLKDIYPQNAVDLNMFSKNSPIYHYFRRQETELYDISDFIGTMSPANSEYLLKNNPKIDLKKVEVCPNSIIPLIPFVSENDKRNIKLKYNIPLNKTMYIYGGNMGKPQGIKYLIECLKMNEFNSDTFIVLVGSGTEFKTIKTYFEENKPKNALLIHFLPKQEYDLLVNSADVGLIFLDNRFTIPNFPSRLLPYMQASLPILAATDENTDIRILIENENMGFWNKSTDVNAFNENLLQLTNDKLRNKQGSNSRKFLEENFTSDNSYDIIMSHFR